MRVLAGFRCLLVPGRKVLHRDLESIWDYFRGSPQGALVTTLASTAISMFCHKPALTMYCLDGMQRCEILEHCGSEGIIRRTAKLSDIPDGWHVLQTGKHCWGESEDTMRMYSSSERV